MHVAFPTYPNQLFTDIKSELQISFFFFPYSKLQHENILGDFVVVLLFYFCRCYGLFNLWKKKSFTGISSVFKQFEWYFSGLLSWNGKFRGLRKLNLYAVVSNMWFYRICRAIRTKLGNIPCILLLSRNSSSSLSTRCGLAEYVLMFSSKYHDSFSSKTMKRRANWTLFLVWNDGR